jgi:hypothetical protein
MAKQLGGRMSVSLIRISEPQPNLSPSQNFPGKRSRDRHWMRGQSAELPQYTLRVMEDAELSQYRRPVVIDSFPGKTIIGTERIDSAKRDFDSPPCRRQATPFPQLRSANHDFKQNCVRCDVPAYYLDLQVRQRFHQLLIKLANSINAFIVFAPRLVVILRRIAEGLENSFQVMLVLQPNVLLDNCDTRLTRIVLCFGVYGNRCARHIHPALLEMEAFSQEILPLPPHTAPGVERHPKPSRPSN